MAPQTNEMDGEGGDNEVASNSDHSSAEAEASAQEWIQRQCSTLAFIVLFITYPNCASTIFAYFRCETFNQPGEVRSSESRVLLT